MIKIKYPTLDLFTYNLIDGTSNTQDYWSKLPHELKQNGFSTKINDEDSQRLDFWNTISSAVDGSYSRANFDDTDCLRYSCSIDKEIELSDIEPTLTQIKDLAFLPKVENLASEKVSDNGYLGQTWMISGWTVPDGNKISEDDAHQAYKALIPQGYQYEQLGEFLGAIVYEMWRGEGRWEGIEKNSHVIIIVYPNKSTFQKAAQYYNTWRYLFYCRHKILWAYAQGRELKLRLLHRYKSGLIDKKSLESLSQKGLQELKRQLEININTLYSYVQDINLLQTQQHTVEINSRNYEKQRCSDVFKNQKFLEEFSRIVKDKYLVQLEQDYLSLNPGLAILENTTATIRGMVEIEQAQRDRHLNTTIAIAGVGLATSQIASAVIIAQQNPPKSVAFYQTQVFWVSIGAGAIASFAFWIILSLSIKIIHHFRR